MEERERGSRGIREEEKWEKKQEIDFEQHHLRV